MSGSIWGNLIGYNLTNGKLEARLAKKYFVEKNSIRFVLDESIRTSKGDVISPKDVKISFLRTILSSDENDPLREIVISNLCGLPKLRHIEQDCPGIILDKNTVTFEFKDRLPGVISLFTNFRYAIIPSDSIDKKTLEIKNYSNSTGAYYYAGTKNGRVSLRRNQNYQPQQFKSSPLEIIIVRDGMKPEKNEPKSIALLKDGSVDFVPYNNIWSQQNSIDNLPEAKGPIEVYATEESGINFAAFTEKGRKY